METRTESPASGRLASPAIQLALVVLFVLALRLPFLNQAVQGDDVYYLYGAEHAQIEPAHPYNTHYVFMGDVVEMRGHSHPPFDVWFLGLLLAMFGDVNEAGFHAAYILFSLIAGVSALAIARRWTSVPLLATILFLVTPTFVVNGTSFESDLPFVAFFLASIALFDVSLPLACLAMTLAALCAYQAVLLVPILWLYAWRNKARRARYVAALTPVAAIVIWQVFERLSRGAIPAGVLAGYLQAYGFEAVAQKVKSAVALTGHLGWLIFPALTFACFGVRRFRFLAAIMVVAALWDYNPLFWLSVGAGCAVLIWCAEHWREWIAQWILIFFAAAAALAFAGSARYLLPVVLPVAITASLRLSRKWLYAGIALQLILSLGLAVVNYKHWNGYRQFARSLAADVESKRVWVNGEWGLRYYFEALGALPLQRGQAVLPGEVVVSSAVAYPFKVTTGGGILTPLASIGITSRIPLRIVGIDTKSAYSSAGLGLRPFDISTGPIDFARAEIVAERAPKLEYVPMDSPDAEQQIVSGIYEEEGGAGNRFRWMSGKGVLLLKAPAEATPVKVQLYMADQAPARAFHITAGDHLLGDFKFERPGLYTISTLPYMPAGKSSTLTITADKTFSVAGDHRDLGVILKGAGFQK